MTMAMQSPQQVHAQPQAATEVYYDVYSGKDRSTRRSTSSAHLSRNSSANDLSPAADASVGAITWPELPQFGLQKKGDYTEHVVAECSLSETDLYCKLERKMVELQDCYKSQTQALRRETKLRAEAEARGFTREREREEEFTTSDSAINALENLLKDLKVRAEYAEAELQSERREKMARRQTEDLLEGAKYELERLYSTRNKPLPPTLLSRVLVGVGYSKTPLTPSHDSSRPVQIPMTPAPGRGNLGNRHSIPTLEPPAAKSAPSLFHRPSARFSV